MLPDQETIIDHAARAERIGEVFSGFKKLTEPRAGCLVLFWVTNKQRPEHIGTMLDLDRFIHITAGTKVAISRVSQPFWAMRIMGFYDYD